MIHEESSAPAHPSREPDDIVETHYAGLERLECTLCYRGIVFVGRLEMTEEGEEIEVVEQGPAGAALDSLDRAGVS